MKKVLFLLFFALPFFTLKVTAQTDMVRSAVIQTVNEDGTGLMVDSQTAEVFEYITRDGEFHFGASANYISRDGEFHRDANGKMALAPGTLVAYKARSINDTKKSLLGLIR